MFQGIRLRTKLLIALLAMSSIPFLVIGTLSITTSNSALSDLAFGQLESLRDVKKTHIQRFFEERRRNMGALLKTVAVFQQTAFEKMRSVQEVKKAQVEEYFRKFRTDITVLATNVNLFKMKNFEILLDGHGGIRLATLDIYETQYFGTSLKQLTKDYGYDDLLLITAKGNVVYTVARGPDLGQNLLTGPLQESSLAACFRQGLHAVTIQDFAPYPPFENAPMAFIAAPVVNAQLNITVGVVAFRISPQAMNTIVHRREGMGVSGETFLVGRLQATTRLRSDQIVRGGKVNEDVTDVELDRMFSGVSGALLRIGRTGAMELTHYDTLKIEGLNWGIITAMSLEEAITPTLEDDNGDYFTQFIHQYGYTDLLLIHPDGTVFYTVAHHTDYGANLMDGPHAATGLGQVFRQVLESKTLQFADFQPYAPFGGKPVAFMAQPVLKNDTVELIVAVQMPIDAINAVMQERSGMGLTGETYLVGPDHLMRSDSFADPQRYAVAASFAHPETGRVDTQASREALAGKTGQARITNYRDQPVLSAYAPLRIWGVTWALVAEMRTDEAFAAVRKLSALISGGGIMVLVGIIVFSLLVTGYITTPIHQLAQLAQKVSEGDLSNTLQSKRPSRDEIGILIQAFNAMIRQLRQSFETLEARVAARTHELNESNQQLQIAKDAAEAARRAAETANKAKSVFLANMSHELRTPLNAILGFSHLLERDDVMPPAQRQQAHVISQSGEYLLTLINDVLDLSKVEAGRMQLAVQGVDLFDLLDGIYAMLYIRAERKGLFFHIRKASDVPQYIKTDARKVRQIVLNLLGNAIKFTCTGGVTLRVKRLMIDDCRLSIEKISQQSTIRFEVEDTGVGIAADELPLLFEMFTQTGSGRASGEGTGLGLALSRRLAHLLGGDITVQSEVGRGSVFTFTIPVEQADNADALTLQPQRVLGLEPEQPAYRILIVDDYAPSRAFLRQFLQNAGFTVREAANGQEGLQAFETWEPQVVLMDLRMPVMDGYEATRRIREQEKKRESDDIRAVIIIALTASSVEEDQAIALRSGFDGFLRKPCPENELFETLRRHLHIRYRYAEKPPPQHEPESFSSDVLKPESVAALPQAVLTELQQAVLTLNVSQTQALLDQLYETHPAIAQALNELARQFQYHRILDVLTRAKEEKDGI